MNLKDEQIEAIRAAWCRETSADPDGWTPDNPAWGQCAVTALVVQDLLGGELLRNDYHMPDGSGGGRTNCRRKRSMLSPEAEAEAVVDGLADITRCDCGAPAEIKTSWGWEGCRPCFVSEHAEYQPGDGSYRMWQLIKRGASALFGR